MLPDNVPLPDLPALLGPSNLDHWSDVLHGLLAQMDHKEHLQYTFPGPQPEDLGLEIDDDDHALDRKIRKRRTFLQDGQNINPHVEGSCGGDWYQRTHDLESYLDNRLYPDSRFTHDDLRNWRLKGSRIVLLIKASLEKVRQYLIASGWKPQVNTVKYHYDFIMHEIPKMGKVDGKSVQSNAGTVVSGGWSSAFIHEDCLIKTLTPVEIVKKMANLKQSSAPCGPDGSGQLYSSLLLDLRSQLHRAKIDSVDKILACMAVNGLSDRPVKTALASYVGNETVKHDLDWDVVLMQIVQSEIPR